MTKITRADLDEAAEQGIIQPAQAEALWRHLAVKDDQRPAFRPAHILYYLGGLVAIAAISLFVTTAWNAWAGLPMLVLALSLAAVGVGLTERFLRRGLTLPAGLTITFAVATVPLAVYSLQQILGLWGGDHAVADYHRHIDWRWYFMELATLAAAAIALWRYRLPFTMLLVAITAWYLSMDLAALIEGPEPSWSGYLDLRRLISLNLGLVTLALAFWVDVRTGRERDFAFWLYLAGAAMFWGGLTASQSESELAKLGYCLVNLALVGAGAVLMRRVLAVFGGLGIALYLGHLAQLFSYSLLFPVALAAIGLAIIYAGIWWQRHEDRLHEVLLQGLPGPVKTLVIRAHSE